MKKHSILCRIISILLILSITNGLFPEVLQEWLSISHAIAEQEKENRKISEAVIHSLNSVFEPVAAFGAQEREKGNELKEGPWRYVVTEDGAWAIVTGHGDTSARKMAVPQTLGGADVVALAAEALADHDALEQLDLPGNVNAIADNAIPLGTTLRCYNGSFTQSYASEGKYPFQSLSRWDFVTGIVDFGDIQVGQFIRYSQYSLLLRNLEAMRLTVGSQFFLLDPENLYQISYYKAEAIEDNGDGFSLITCSTPDVNEMMYTLHGEDETMVLDMSTLQLEDGVTLINDSPRLSLNRAFLSASTSGIVPSNTRSQSQQDPLISGKYTEPVIAPLSFIWETKLPDGTKLKASLSMKHMIVATYQGGVFQKKDVSIKDEASISGEIKWEEKKDTEPDKEVKEKLNKLETFSNSDEYKELFPYLEGLPVSEVLESGFFRIPMGVGAAFTVGGVISGLFRFNLVAEIKGTFSIAFEYKTTTVIKADSNGNTQKESYGESASLKMNGKASGKIGPEFDYNVYFGFIKCLEMKVFFGFGFEATVNLSDMAIIDAIWLSSSSGAFSLDYNLLGKINSMDYINIKVTAYLEVEIKAGLTTFDSLTAKIKWKPWEMTIAEIHIHYFPYVYGWDEYGNLVAQEAKNMFHNAVDCPYKGHSVSFLLPADIPVVLLSDILYQEVDDIKYYIFKKYESLTCGTTINEPEPPRYSSDTAIFDGWYETKDFSGDPATFPIASGNFDLKLYGKVREKGKIIFHWNDGNIITTDYCFPDDEISFPLGYENITWMQVDPENDLEFINVFAKIENGSPSQSTMPDVKEIHLMAVSEDEYITINYFEDVDGTLNELSQKTARPNQTLKEPEYEYRVGMICDGWTDENGEAITFPYALQGETENREFTLHWHHINLEDMPEGMGVGMYPGNGESVQSGQDYFTFQVNSDGTATVTGFNTSMGNPVNIRIPSKYTYTQSGETKTCSVTQIGSSAFSNKPSLLTVYVPSSIEEIGTSAFSGCSNLGKIDLSISAISAIPNSMCSNCTSLVEIVLPEGNVSIGNNAFENCKSLIIVKLNGISIGSYAFKGCEKIESVQLTNVETINTYAFSGCSGLQTLDLGTKLESISGLAFENCSSLTKLYIPDSVRSIYLSYGRNEGPFTGCTGLQEISIGGVSEITPCMLHTGSRQLKKLTIRGTVSTISDRALNGAYGWESDAELIIEEGVQSIGYSAFSECKAFTSVTLPSTLENIGASAFCNCSSLLEIDTKNTKTIGDSAFSGCTKLRNAQLTNVEAIGNYSFRDCISLQSLDLGTKLESISGEAFYNCSSLKKLYIPDSVKSIIGTRVGGVFGGCTSLQEISIGGVKTLENGMLKTNSNELKKLIIRGTVSDIGENALSDYFTMESDAELIIEEGVQSIGYNAFCNCKAFASVTLPSTLENIGNRAFYNCSSLLEIDTKNTKTIGEYAFSGCTRLGKAQLTNVETINTYAFSGCSGLQTLDLGTKLESISGLAFENCSSLTKLYIPDSIRSIILTRSNEGPFTGCTSLQEISIGGVKALEHGMLKTGSNKLKKLIIRGTISNIGEDAINGYYTMESDAELIIEEGVQSIGNSAFRNCKCFSTIVLPSSLVSISDSAFSSHLPALQVYTAEFNQSIYDYTSRNGLNYAVLSTAGYPEFTVQFINPYEAENTSMLVRFLDTIDLPSVIVPENKVFAGWYQDSDFTIPVETDFKMPAHDLTLYAKFVSLNAVQFVVQLPINTTLDGMVPNQPSDLPNGFVLYAVNEQTDKDRIVLPADPQVSGYVFDQWYLDVDFTTPFKDEAVPEDGLTLYGRFTSAGLGGIYETAGEGMVITHWYVSEGDGEKAIIPTAMNGKTVTGIGAKAFSDAKVKEIRLPDGLVTVDSQAFSENRTLQNLVISDKNTEFKTVNGVLYSKDMTVLYRYPAGRTAHKFSIPATVKYIAPYAFEDARNLREVHFPSGLLSVGEHAFEDCSNLTSVYLPDTTTAIEDSSFAGCYDILLFEAQGLQTMGSNALPVNNFMYVYGSLGEGVLRDWCIMNDLNQHYNMTLIRIMNDTTLLTAIQLEAGTLIDVIYSHGETDDGSFVTGLYKDQALTQAWDFASDTVPREELTLYAQIQPEYEYETIEITQEDGTVLNGLLLTAYHGDGGNAVVPSEVSGSPVLALGSNLFATSFGSVTSVEIPASVVQIMDDALGMDYDGSIKADEGSYAAAWATEKGYLHDVSIYTLAFNTLGGASISAKNVSAGTFVRLPQAVRTGADFIGWFMDEDCTEPVALNEQNLFVMPNRNVALYAGYESEEGSQLPFLFEETNGSITITGYTGNDMEIVIPETINGLPVSTIGKRAFAGMKITSVHLAQVEKIEESAFANCKSLSSIDLTGSIRTIEDNAFSDCTTLTDVMIGANVESIGKHAFAKTAVQAFQAEDGGTYTAIDGVLVKGNTIVYYPPAKTGDYVMPEGLVSIGEYAFENTAITRISFASTLNSIGSNAFSHSGLQEIHLENTSVAVIPSHMAIGCADLSVVTLGSRTVSIGNSAFVNCGKLVRADIPEQVTSVGIMAFAGCANDFTIYGTYGSAAEAWAVENECLFIDEQAEQITSITIISDKDALRIGEWVDISAAVEPVNAADHANIQWYVNDSEILRIQDGKLIGLKRGITTVTALSQDGKKGTKEFTVIGVPAERIVIQPMETYWVVGTAVQLTADISPVTAEDDKPVWSSLNPTVATIDENGLVSFLSAGEAVFHVETISGRCDEITLKAYIPVSGLTLPDIEGNEAEIVLYLTDGMNQAQCIPIIEPVNATFQDLTWTSSDTQIASVDDSGTVTVLKTGTADIIASTIWTIDREPISFVWHVAAESCRKISISSVIEHGSVVADKLGANDGDTVTLTVTPTSGYAIDTVSYNDGSDHTITPVEGVYSFTMPDADVTVTASFVQVAPCFTQAALELGGVLNLRYYVSYPDGYDPTGDYVEFTVNNGSPRKATALTDQNGTYFTCPVNAFQMADPITAVYYHGEEEAARKENYTVEKNLNNLCKTETDQKTLDFIHAAMDFGSYIQPFLAATNHWTVGTDHAEMTAYNSSLDVMDSVPGTYAHKWEKRDSNYVEKGLFALSLEADTTLRVLVKLQEGVSGTVTGTVNGTEVTPQLVNVAGVGQAYQLTLRNIPSNALVTAYPFTLSVDGTVVFDLRISALSYAYIVLPNSQDAAQNKALTALYNYAIAAHAYKAE